MFRHLKKFFAREDGNIAMTAGLTLPVAVVMSMGALEYGTVLNRKQALENAANTAALSAVNEALIAYKNNEDVDLEEMIASVAQSSFEASAAGIGNISRPIVDANAKVNKNTLSVEVQYSASYNTIFGKFAGKENIKVAGDANAAASAESYMNFTFLFDVSASMGIGATPDDQRKVAEVANNCAFACHIHASDSEPSTYDKARANGADMRIDVARSAALNTLGIIEENAAQPDQYTVGAFVFDNVVTQISDHTDSRSSDMNFVGQNIRDGVFMKVSHGGTNLDHAMSTIANELPVGGAGRSREDRRQVLIVLTDGVQDSAQFYAPPRTGWTLDRNSRGNWPFLRNESRQWLYTLNNSACEDLQNRNVEIYFIHTDYLIPQGGDPSVKVDKMYDFIERRLNKIAPQRFATCTGDSNRVFQASTPAEIEAAFSELLSQTTAPLHLF